MRFWARSCGKGIRDYPSGGISNGSHPAETPRPNLQTSSSRDRPRVWAASTFAATLGVLLRRLQPRGSRLVPTEPLALTPHPRRAQAHPDRPKERSSLYSAPPPPPAPPAVVGEGASPPRSRVAGERNPVAVATVSKRTGGGSRPARAPSLTGALLPLLPSLRCGLGEGLPAVPVRVRVEIPD